jgi:hypothetical protein
MESQVAVLVEVTNPSEPVTPGGVVTVSICGSVDTFGRNVRLEGLTARPAGLIPAGATTKETVAHAVKCIGPT